MFTGDVLKGKRILVTGGGTGLGKEMSVGFAAHGAQVFICGRRPDVLDQAVSEIRSRSGGEASALVANVRDPDKLGRVKIAPGNTPAVVKPVLDTQTALRDSHKE